MSRILYLATNHGVVEHLVCDEAERRYAVHYQADVTEQIEANKAELADPGRGIDGLGRKVASIPPSVALEWCVRHGVDLFNKDHWPAVRRLLNDPEWRYLRTAPGKLR